MKKYVKHIMEESLQDEVDVDKEWSRLYRVIVKKQNLNSIAGMRKRLYMQGIKYAAAVVLGGLLSAAVFYFPKEETPILSYSYKMVTEKGEKSFLQLPDGSKVWLNTATVLEYAADYGITNRDIHLNGEAYFEVAKNEKIPFIVKTGNIDVTAVGTAFNVYAYKDDPRLVTTLFEGKVAVQPTQTKQRVLLAPNEVAVYYKEKNRIETMPYNKQMFARWREGGLSFEMMYLEDIAKLLERNYNVVFLFDNQKIKKLRFSGHFNNNEALSEILKVIKTNTGINYHALKDTIIIK